MRMRLKEWFGWLPASAAEQRLVHAHAALTAESSVLASPHSQMQSTLAAPPHRRLPTRAHPPL